MRNAKAMDAKIRTRGTYQLLVMGVEVYIQNELVEQQVRVCLSLPRNLESQVKRGIYTLSFLHDALYQLLVISIGVPNNGRSYSSCIWPSKVFLFY